jgi:hypothetical protein
MCDPLKLLLEIAKEKTVPGKWDNQPLLLIKIMANSTKGDLGEIFVTRYCRELGLKVTDKASRLGDYDVQIDGADFEVKMATEDITGNFQFNHIRYDYKYDWILCLGVAPAEIFFKIYSKSDLVTGKAGNLVSMGRGQNSSFKLTKKKSDLLAISKFEESMKSLPKLK